LGRPVFWGVGVGHDVNVGVLGGHEHHFVDPGHANVDADQFQFTKSGIALFPHEEWHS
jgi:hypothetical protein